MISDVKLPYHFLLSKVKNMFVALESFRKQYQSIKRKQPLRQKQSVTDVLQHGCFKKFRNIHRKAPVSESLFNKVTGLKT